VDHNELFQKGIASALAPYQDINLVGTARDLYTALDLCAQQNPDVVIVEIQLPTGDGANIIRQIRQKANRPHIMVLTHHRTVELVHDVFAAGALSYLMKDISVDELVNAVREASRGNTVIAYEVAQALVKKPKESNHIENLLTAREQEVMGLLMKGYKNSDIAEELVISLATVKKHVRKILSKLDVNSRTEAVAVAYTDRFALA
jgi:DNA-binding NarL/FixJ family response regulator